MVPALWRVKRAGISIAQCLIMRKGLLELPNGDVVRVEERHGGMRRNDITPYYEAPEPWSPETWFVVPTDKRKGIVWVCSCNECNECSLRQRRIDRMGQ